jgi:hypothetical protein
MLCNLPSVDLSRKPDVGDQHVRNVALAPRESFFACARVNHMIARLAQRFDDQLTDKEVILDYQHAHRSTQPPMISATNLERSANGEVPDQ